MGNKELLEKIWNLENVKRPAVIVEESIGYEPANANTSIHIEDYEVQYQNAIAYYDSLRKDRDDNVPALNTAMGTFVIPTVFGAAIRSFGDGRRYIDKSIILEAQDIDKLKPIPLLDSILGHQIKLVEYFQHRIGGSIPIRIPDLQNPLGVAAMLWETTSFYTSLVDEPERVHRLLSIITEVIIECVNKLKEACPNVVPVSWPWIWAPTEKGIHLSDDTMSMVSPDMYEEYGVHYNNIISREFGGVFLHSCTTNKRYFNSIIKNKGLRSINFAAQYSSEMKEIYEFFGGKAVILPHYVHTDNPQIGTLPEFVEKVLDCWTPKSPTIIYVSAKPEGGLQQEVFNVLEARGFSIK